MERGPASRTIVGVPTRELTNTADGSHGQVRRRDLECGDWLVVRTRNSVYTLLALEQDRFAVSGGWFDQQKVSPSRTTVTGCTWGGSAINQDIVASPGLCLEFGNRVMTSRIQRVEVVRQTPEAVN